jgi:hypothetical protein
MSQEEGKTYVAPLPFNWAKMGLGWKREYLCAAQETLARLGDIMALTEKHLTDETTAGSHELQDHFKTIQHLASMSSSHLYSQIEACEKEEVTTFSEEEKKFKDVHTEHCCAKHGCKYGDAVL